MDPKNGDLAGDFVDIKNCSVRLLIEKFELLSVSNSSSSYNGKCNSFSSLNQDQPQVGTTAVWQAEEDWDTVSLNGRVAETVAKFERCALFKRMVQEVIEQQPCDNASQIGDQLQLEKGQQKHEKEQMPMSPEAAQFDYSEYSKQICMMFHHMPFGNALAAFVRRVASWSRALREAFWRQVSGCEDWRELIVEAQSAETV